MDMVFNAIVTKINIMDNFKMESLMAKENTIGQMVHFMMEILKMVIEKVKEDGDPLSKAVIVIMENITTIKNKDMEDICGPTVAVMKEILKMM